MIGFQSGQRYISTMEPELGLGLVTETAARTVTLVFSAAQCSRRYAADSAPLKRVRFSPGDTVRLADGSSHRILETREEAGLYIYRCAGLEIPEAGLSGSLSFADPKERLLSGYWDSQSLFSTRYQTWLFRAANLKSPALGFIGPRIMLIPHQLYVAHSVASCSRPRVLLSDETGLGKTIEACLVLHRMLLTDRISRVLIIVPEPLIYQWFVELLRKFNLLFRLLDEETCRSLEQTNEEENPFVQESLWLTSIDSLSGHPGLSHRLADAGWDLVILDEAHHLIENTGIYKDIEAVSRSTASLILISATPCQLGLRNHFARLHLLDPDRYHDPAAFEAESGRYQEIAGVARRIDAGATLDAGEKRLLKKWIPDADLSDSRPVLEKLIDLYGPGRVLYRNTRHVMDFPPRRVELIPLKATDAVIKQFRETFVSLYDDTPAAPVYHFSGDPRIEWLAGLLRRLKNEKILLICESAEAAVTIGQALKGRIQVSSALFHEHLSLINRDKNAAYFSRKEGARLLISSEIGGEGRNFQFARHLVLFDLPLNPEKLEQRIGRLDRIGQKNEIHIHVPYIKGTPQEVLALWYQSLGIFERNLAASYEIGREMGETVRSMALTGEADPDFLEKARKRSTRLEEIISGGRDWLLEKHSFDKEAGERIVENIRRVDSDQEFRIFTSRLLNPFGLRMEHVAGSIYEIHLDLLNDPALPVPPLREERLFVTFDRSTAVEREDLEFFTPDHPMITGAVDLFLSSERGNSSAVLCSGAGSDGIRLEAVFIAECLAPAGTAVSRFFPPTPVKILVDADHEDWTGREPDRNPDKIKVRRLPEVFLENPDFRTAVEDMIRHAEEIAAGRLAGITEEALQAIHREMENEIGRLTALKKRNPDAGDDIPALKAQRDALALAIRDSRLRLDALSLSVLRKASSP